MVCAPSYIEARGEPAAVAELSRHNCIGYRLISTGAAYAWDLRDGDAELAVAVAGTVRVTDSGYARELALSGVGIAYLFEPLVRADIRAGRLTWVLPAASIEEPGLFLYFPRGAAAMPKLRAFLDVAHEVLRPAREE